MLCEKCFHVKNLKCYFDTYGRVHSENTTVRSTMYVSKRAFSNYEVHPPLLFAKSTNPPSRVVSHRLQKCLFVKQVKFNYTTIA
jgi:hypothetical protein